MITIDPLNGQIRTKKKLTEFLGLYQYEITLMDNGPASLIMSNETKKGINANEQSNLSGTCKLEIFVKDYNIHAPEFIYPNANNSVIRIKSVNVCSRI